MARNKYKRTTQGKRLTLERRAQRVAKATVQDLGFLGMHR